MADRRVTIDVEARFEDNVSGRTRSARRSIEELGDAADRTQRRINNLGNRRTRPRLDADDNRLTRKLRALEEKLRRLSGRRAEVILGAKDRVSSVLSKVFGKVKQFTGKTHSAILKLKDSGVFNTLNKVNSAARKIVGKTWNAAVRIKDYATAPLNKIKNALFSIKSLVLAITAGMAAKQFIAKPIGIADAYSSAKIGFQTLLGESRGQAMMDDLDEFAKATPFKTSEVIANTQKMIAMGWQADNIIKDMTTIGDAAAATGKGDEGLNRIVLALAQIRSKGKLSTEELNQLAEAGISAKRYLAEGLGYGSGDEGIMKLSKDLEDGAIGAEAAIKAITEGMKEYQGMMDKTANETVSGLKSQIEDAFEINIFRRWGQGLQDGAKKSFGSIVKLLDDADVAFTKFGDTLYEVGSTVSNWAADKLEKAVKRITEVTDTYEFKNASLGEKLSMLWKGVVTDPLKEWWEGGGQQKMAATAEKIGSFLGKTFSSVLKGIFGMTDILKDSGDIGSGIGGVAQSFAKGFVDNFDVSGIVDKVMDAISNIWNALPTWGKALLGGYLLTGENGIGNVFDTFNEATETFSSIREGIGTVGNATERGTGALGFLSSFGYRLSGGREGSNLGGRMAALKGFAGAAGAATMAVGGIHAIGEFGRAIKSYREGDKQSGKAHLAGGIATGVGIAGGALAGMKLGAMIGSVGGPLGTLIGGGLGTVAGWFVGDKISKSIAAAKYESQEMKDAIKDSEMSAEELAETFDKAVYQNMKQNMGDIQLSLSEIGRLAEQIVWGDKLENFEAFTQAAKNAEANLSALKSAAASTDKWMWKAGLGVKFNKDEKESFQKSFDEYISAAQQYVENKHYEFTAAVNMLIDTNTDDGKAIIKTGDAFFQKMQNQLNSLGGELSKKVDIALKDGVITLDEQAEIANLQQQIAEITNKIASAESSAKMDLVKMKFGNGTLDAESFENLMAQMQTTIDERMSASDEAFVASVSKLKLQLDEGAITEEEYNKQVETLTSGYTATIDELRAQVENVELDIVAKSGYGDMLGADAKEKLKGALQEAMSTGIDPIEWSTDDVRRILGAESLSEEAAGALRQILSGIFGQEEALQVDGKVLTSWEVQNEEDPGEKIKGSIPESVSSTVDVEITGDPNFVPLPPIDALELGVPPEKAATINLLLTGKKEVLNKINVSQLAKEFGIPESQAKTVIEKLTGEKSIQNRLNILSSDFGIPKSISERISVNITGVVGKVTNLIGDVTRYFTGGGKNSGGKKNGFRGGIFGGDNIPGYSDGGMVRGGAQLVTVAEEGNPEMIIPLSSQRRGRALKLWAQAGNIMGVPGFARGGMTAGGQDEGIRFNQYGSGDSVGGGQSVIVDVGGVSVEIHVDATGGQNIAEAIQEQSGEIAETVAGILADAFGAQFENTPTRGGVA